LNRLQEDRRGLPPAQDLRQPFKHRVGIVRGREGHALDAGQRVPELALPGEKGGRNRLAVHALREAHEVLSPRDDPRGTQR
jgi:hypothetical protein